MREKRRFCWDGKANYRIQTMARMNVARHRGTINLASMIRRRTLARSLVLLLFRQSGNEAVVFFSFFLFFTGKVGQRGEHRRGTRTTDSCGSTHVKRFKRIEKCAQRAAKLIRWMDTTREIIVLTESRESWQEYELYNGTKLMRKFEWKS